MTQPLADLLLRNIPDFLHANGVDLRIASLIEMQFLDELLRERTAGAFGENRDLRVNVDSGLVVPFRLAVLVDALVAGANADDAVAFHQQLGAGKSGEDIDCRFARPARRASG